jgi:hypothetical protein
MRTTIGAAWLTPTSIEARLFANRDKDRARLEDILDDLFQSHNPRSKIMPASIMLTSIIFPAPAASARAASGRHPGW